MNVMDDVALSAYPQQSRAAYCGEYNEGLHATVPETYPSDNTAAKRSEIEVARPSLPDARSSSPKPRYSLAYARYSSSSARSSSPKPRYSLPDAIRNQLSDSMPTSKAPTMALDDVPEDLIRGTPGQFEILDPSGRTSSDAVAHG